MGLASALFYFADQDQVPLRLSSKEVDGAVVSWLESAEDVSIKWLDKWLQCIRKLLS